MRPDEIHPDLRTLAERTRRIYELFPDNWLRLRQDAAEPDATDAVIPHASES